MKRIIGMALAAAVLLSCAACGDSGVDAENTAPQQSAADTVGEQSGTPEGYPLTIQDYFEYETVLETPPQRAAVLSGTALNIWYDLGGKSVCTSEISGNLKLVEEYADEIRALPSVGAVYSLNLEAVLAQDADLIVTQAGVQTDSTKALRDMDLPVVSVLPRTFEDMVETYRLFGQILCQEELAEEKIRALTEERQSYIDRAPEQGKRVVILYLTSNSLSVKLNSSIAGDIAASLGIRNIAAELPPETIGSENTPLDIEYLVEQDPDLVLVTSMIGSNALAVETMERQFAENQAWQSVDAVAEGRVAYLPQEYYLYNAGPYYGEAVHYMACAVYPEIFGEVTDWYGK